METLVRLPVRNLERMIGELEGEISQRHRISDDILAALGAHRLQLLGEIERMKYLDIGGQLWQSRQELKRRILKVEESIAGESVHCFRDVSWLMEKLREAREALSEQEQRLRLLEESDG